MFICNMKKLLFLAFIFSSFFSLAQKCDTTYFNERWENSDSSSARYVKYFKKLNDTTFHVIKKDFKDPEFFTLYTYKNKELTIIKDSIIKTSRMLSTLPSPINMTWEDLSTLGHFYNCNFTTNAIVVVSFVISAKGNIKNVAILSSSGNTCIDEEAISMIYRIGKFKPATEDGIPIDLSMSIPINVNP